MNRVPSFIFCVAMAAIALFPGVRQSSTPKSRRLHPRQRPRRLRPRPPHRNPKMRKNGIHLLRSLRPCCNRA